MRNCVKITESAHRETPLTNLTNCIPNRVLPLRTCSRFPTLYSLKFLISLRLVTLSSTEPLPFEPGGGGGGVRYPSYLT